MWENSIYRFRIPTGRYKNGQRLLKEIVFDVTFSSPPDKDPNKEIVRHVLNPVFDRIKKDKKKKEDKKIYILDMGAGKLRYSLHILEEYVDEGYEVCAVEYIRLRKGSKVLQNNLKEIKKYEERFTFLEYPKKFIGSPSETYDLVLLINVINTIPIPYERLLLLNQCRLKLKPKGYLLCCTWYGQEHFRKNFKAKNRIADGYFIGEDTNFKSFGLEYKSVEELDEIITATGFEFKKSYPISKANARLYQKKEGTTYTIFSRVLSQKRLNEYILGYKNIKNPESTKPKSVVESVKNKECIPDPEELRMESLYTELLGELDPGHADALKYQRLIYLILGRLFRPKLRGFRIEQVSSIERIDIVARNHSKDGFWGWLSSKKNIHCPYIIFECKNSKKDPKNPEFQQIATRLHDDRGKFGMLVYRKTKDMESLIERCKSFKSSEKKYIMPIEDKDIVYLLDLKMKGLEREIEEMLSNKFDAIFF